MYVHIIINNLLIRINSFYQRQYANDRKRNIVSTSISVEVTFLIF